mgnify:CR=1 FL=1
MDWIKIKAYLVVAFGVFVWSTGLPLIDHLLDKWDFMSLATARSLIGGLFLFTISIIRSRRIPNKEISKKASFIGITTYGVSAVCTVIGISYSDPFTASILVTLIPVISAVIDLFTSKRTISWNLALALLFSIVGGMLASFEMEQFKLIFGIGELFVFASIFLFVLYSRQTLKYLKCATQISVLSISTLSGGIGMLIVTILSSFMGNELNYSFEPRYLIPLLILGIISMGLSVQFWFYGVKRLGVTQASLLQNLVPLYVMLIMLALGNSFQGMKALGGLFVIFAAIIAQIEEKKF